MLTFRAEADWVRLVFDREMRTGSFFVSMVALALVLVKVSHRLDRVYLVSAGWACCKVRCLDNDLCLCR